VKGSLNNDNQLTFEEFYEDEDDGEDDFD